MKTKWTFTKVWKNFCNDTTVVGFKYVSGARAKTKFGCANLAWVFGLGFSTALLLWKIGLFCQRYFKFDVKTSITYEIDYQSLTLPAYTVCNVNMFRRSVVGNRRDFLVVLNSVFGTSNNIDKNKATCKPMNNSKIPYNSSDDIFELFYKHGYSGMMHLIGMPANVTLVKCWHFGSLIDCNDIVYNHLTDIGFCFTLNPPVNSGNKIYHHLFGNKSYSKNVSGQLLSTNLQGPYGGMQFLMNLNQQEYCGLFQFESKYIARGAGFKSYVHGQNDNSIFMDTGAIHLHPGRFYNIAVRPILRRRETESLGYCSSRANIPNLNISEPYIHSLCQSQCYAKFVLDKCRCIPPIFNADSQRISQLFGDTMYSACIAGEDLKCFSRRTQDFIRKYNASWCPQCLPQCRETAYYTVVSETAFPAKNQLSYFKRLLNESESKWIEKNYVLANIYFDSKTAEVVTETQAYLTVDLIYDIGAVMFLYLGMSLMTPFEFAYQLLLICHTIVYKLKRRKVRRRNLVGVTGSRKFKRRSKIGSSTVFVKKRSIHCKCVRENY